MREQLAPLAAHMLEKHGQVTPVSQVHLVARTDSPKETLASIRQVVLKWMENKAGRKLPSGAWDGATFDLDEIGAQRAEAVGFEDRIWAARVDDADKQVPQRTWATEAAIGRSEGTVLFGVRLFCVSRTSNPPFSRSIPGFVKGALAAAPLELDGRLVSSEPWVVGPDDVPSLVALLCSEWRTSPVCVFSLPEGEEDPSTTTIPVGPFLSRTLGASHTVVLTGPATYRLTDHLGKEFSVFQGAVRSYNPGFRPEESQPSDHPLAMAARIEEWSDGPAGFVRMLVNEVLRRSVSERNLERELPSYNSVRQRVRRVELQALQEGKATDSDRLHKAMEESAALREEVDEWRGLCEDSEEERKVAEGTVAELQRQMLAMRARNQHLQAALEAVGPGEKVEELPRDLGELGKWAEQHLAGDVFLHNRALRAAKKSPFEDVRFVYRVLLFLRDRYVPMKRFGGGDGRRAAYLEGLHALGLEEAACFSTENAGAHGDTYFVDYQGRRRQLEMHLKGTNNRDPRYGFRLYFFWDDETEQVVVGSLPNHLETAIS